MVEVLYYAIPFFVLLLVVEAMSFRHYHEDDLVGYELNDTRTSITMGLGNVVVNVAWKLVVVVIYAALYELTPFRMPENAWWAWILLFFADDLAYYWFHRISHVSRFFWASHVVHHSSTHFNLSTALRQTWVPDDLPAVLAAAAACRLPAVDGAAGPVVEPDLPVRPAHGAHRAAAEADTSGSSTRRATTASTTAPTSSTWTATTAAS